MPTQPINIVEKIMQDLDTCELNRFNIENCLNKHLSTQSNVVEKIDNFCNIDESLIEECISSIKEHGKASATLLQRTIGIGFAKAVDILDILENRGLVGPQIGVKPRKIYL